MFRKNRVSVLLGLVICLATPIVALAEEPVKQPLLLTVPLLGNRYDSDRADPFVVKGARPFTLGTLCMAPGVNKLQGEEKGVQTESLRTEKNEVRAKIAARYGLFKVDAKVGVTKFERFQRNTTSWSLDFSKEFLEDTFPQLREVLMPPPPKEGEEVKFGIGQIAFQPKWADEQGKLRKLTEQEAKEFVLSSGCNLVTAVTRGSRLRATYEFVGSTIEKRAAIHAELNAQYAKNSAKIDVQKIVQSIDKNVTFSLVVHQIGANSRVPVTDAIKAPPNDLLAVKAACAKAIQDVEAKDCPVIEWKIGNVLDVLDPALRETNPKLFAEFQRQQRLPSEKEAKLDQLANDAEALARLLIVADEVDEEKLSTDQQEQVQQLKAYAKAIPILRDACLKAEETADLAKIAVGLPSGTAEMVSELCEKAAKDILVEWVASKTTEGVRLLTTYNRFISAKEYRLQVTLPSPALYKSWHLERKAGQFGAAYKNYDFNYIDDQKLKIEKIWLLAGEPVRAGGPELVGPIPHNPYSEANPEFLNAIVEEQKIVKLNVVASLQFDTFNVVDKQIASKYLDGKEKKLNYTYRLVLVGALGNKPYYIDIGENPLKPDLDPKDPK